MSKYEPLGAYLRSKGTSAVPMTFAEIERVVGESLPHSKTIRAWWSNNPSNNVMTKVWLAAGYKTEQVDIEGQKLVFRRAAASDTKPAQPSPSPRDADSPKRHPLFGILKGKVTIAPGTDLTKPADPSWGASD